MAACKKIVSGKGFSISVFFSKFRNLSVCSYKVFALGVHIVFISFWIKNVLQKRVVATDKSIIHSEKLHIDMQSNE